MHASPVLGAIKIPVPDTEVADFAIKSFSAWNARCPRLLQNFYV